MLLQILNSIANYTFNGPFAVEGPRSRRKSTINRSKCRSSLSNQQLGTNNAIQLVTRTHDSPLLLTSH